MYLCAVSLSAYIRMELKEFAGAAEGRTARLSKGGLADVARSRGSTRAGVVYEAPPLLWRFRLRGRRRLRAVARVAIDETLLRKLRKN